jgi:hypothetical protein
LRVRALVRVRWPRIGSPARWRLPRHVPIHQPLDIHGDLAAQVAFSRDFRHLLAQFVHV